MAKWETETIWGSSGWWSIQRHESPSIEALVQSEYWDFFMREHDEDPENPYAHRVLPYEVHIISSRIRARDEVNAVLEWEWRYMDVPADHPRNRYRSCVRIRRIDGGQRVPHGLDAGQQISVQPPPLPQR